MLLPQQPGSGCSWGHSALQHRHFLSRKRLVTASNGSSGTLGTLQMPIAHQSIDFTLSPTDLCSVCAKDKCYCVFLLLRYSTVGAGHGFGSGVPSDALQSGQQLQCTGHSQSKTVLY